MYDQKVKEAREILEKYNLTQGQYKILIDEFEQKITTTISGEEVNVQLTIEHLFKTKGFSPELKQQHVKKDMTSKPKQSMTSIVFGLLLILFGVNMLIPNFELFAYTIIITLLAIAFACFRSKSTLAGLFFIYLSALVSDIEIFNYKLLIYKNIDKFIPVSLIIIGITIMFKKRS